MPSALLGLTASVVAEIEVEICGFDLLGEML